MPSLGEGQYYHSGLEKSRPTFFFLAKSRVYLVNNNEGDVVTERRITDLLYTFMILMVILNKLKPVQCLENVICSKHFMAAGHVAKTDALRFFAPLPPPPPLFLFQMDPPSSSVVGLVRV